MEGKGGNCQHVDLDEMFATETFTPRYPVYSFQMGNEPQSDDIK